MKGPLIHYLIFGLLLVGALLAAPCWGQSAKASGESPAANPPSTKSENRSIPLPPEITEALDDRQLIINEITRISALSGKVEIPISIDELQRRAQVKWQRFTGWLKANGIPEDPREWADAGWSYSSQDKTFSHRTIAPSGEKKE